MRKTTYSVIVAILIIFIAGLLIMNIMIGVQQNENVIICDSEEDILRELNTFFETREMDTITLKYKGENKKNITVNDVDALCTKAFSETEDYLYNWQNIKQKEIRMKTENNSVYITITMTWKENREDLEIAKEKIREIAEELEKQDFSSLGCEAQYMMIADRVTELFVYDNEKEDTSYELYGALTSGKGVCKAYALTYKAVADELGIGENVRFLGSDEGNHSLNEVFVNETWMYVDVTNYDSERNRNYLLFSDYEYPISFIM